MEQLVRLPGAWGRLRAATSVYELVFLAQSQSSDDKYVPPFPVVTA